MKMIKTIGLFLLNKVLELFYHIIKPAVINIAGPILLTIVFLIICSLFGLFEIAFLYGIGFESLANCLFIGSWESDTPLIMRGILVGFVSILLIGLGCASIEKYKETSFKLIPDKIVNFFKSNWELAKSGKIYRP